MLRVRSRTELVAIEAITVRTRELFGEQQDELAKLIRNQITEMLNESK